MFADNVDVELELFTQTKELGHAQSAEGQERVKTILREKVALVTGKREESDGEERESTSRSKIRSTT